MFSQEFVVSHECQVLLTWRPRPNFRQEGATGENKLPLGKAGAVLCQYVWQVCDDGIIR